MKKVFIFIFLLPLTLLSFSQTIKINEFMASNSTTVADEFGEYDDWIELYNYGADTVNIAGFFVTDTLGHKTKHQIPTGYAITKIAPGGFLLLWADNDTLQNGPLHLKFKLSASGEQIGIYAPDGITPIDTLTFHQQITDISYGRYPNGNNTWMYFNFPTPGTSNNLLNVENIDKKNELFFYPNPASNNLITFNKAIDFSFYASNGALIKHYSNTDKLLIENLAQGIYYIVLDNGTKAKVVIMKE